MVEREGLNLFIIKSYLQLRVTCRQVLGQMFHPISKIRKPTMSFLSRIR